jgi:PKD repeat protein
VQALDGPCPNIPPVANFEYHPIPSYVHEPVFFDGRASYDPDGFIINYTWDFGDGNITVNSTAEAEHTYTDAGEYNVSLLVMDNFQATNSTTKAVLVKAHATASFSYSPAFPHVNEIINFDASNSTGGDGTILNYTWDFGDANVSAMETAFITHSYSESKLYNVTLNVTSSNGEWDAVSEIVNVTARSFPKAIFTWLPTVPEAGNPVEFNASDSTSDGGTITSYAWDFGDNTTQVVAQPIVTHIYESFGNYVVLLNVTNNDGFSDAINHSLVVVEKPVAGFFFSPEKPRVCNVVTFNGSISDPRGGQIVSYEWMFEGNSTPQFGVAVTYRFSKMGDYFVSLSVTTGEGLSDIKNVTVKVLPHIADLNEDGKVDILDLAIFARAFGSIPGSDRWNPRADLDGNNIINILDGVVTARSYNMCINPFDP